MSTPKRIVRALMIIIVLAFTIVYIYVAHVGYDVLSLPAGGLPRTTPSGEYQEVTFPSRGQDYKVYAFFMHGQSDGPAIINVHGYHGTRHADYILDRAEGLRELGYNVLSIDLSDNGGDTIGNGRISFGYSERWDVLGAYDYLLAQGYAPDRIGIVAESMGAASSLLAAAQEPRLRAVWADSAYARTDTQITESAAKTNFPTFIVPGGLIWGWLVSGDRLWEAAPIAAASTLAANKQAVYIIHCDQDHTVLYHHGLELAAAYKAAGVDVTFWGIPNHDHAEGIVYHRAEYFQRLDTFFKVHLAESSVRIRDSEPF
ncbi:MAG: prolyl oligopeptidase family serine peptidase [Chloroflexota bacterium]